MAWMSTVLAGLPRRAPNVRTWSTARPSPSTLVGSTYADAFDASAQAAVTVSSPTMRFMERPSWSRAGRPMRPDALTTERRRPLFCEGAHLREALGRAGLRLLRRAARAARGLAARARELGQPAAHLAQLQRRRARRLLHDLDAAASRHEVRAHDGEVLGGRLQDDDLGALLAQLADLVAQAPAGGAAHDPRDALDGAARAGHRGHRVQDDDDVEATAEEQVGVGERADPPVNVSLPGDLDRVVEG